MNSASVGFHCPECVKSGKQKVYQGVAALQTKPLLTQILIAVNVVVFILDQLIRVRTLGGDIGWFTLHGGLFGPYVPTEPWRLVTSGFLHSGLLHIGFNMYALYVIGRVLEPAIGRLRFGALYASSLLAGALGALLIEPEALTVGASGAIFGMVGGLLLLARRRGADAVVKNLLFVLALNLVFTFTISNISKGGHLGGVLGGAVCGFVMLEIEKRTNDEKVAAAAIGAIGVVSAVAAFALMAVKY